MKYNLTSNRTLELIQEDCPESPREWDNLSKMIFASHRNLGDNHRVPFNDYDYEDRQDFITKGAEVVKKHIKDIAIIKAVHLYEHSGIAISTSMSGNFGCRWDSGTCGFVVVTKADIRKEYGVKRITAKTLAKAEAVLEAEVETLNLFIGSEIYYFNIENEDGEHEDSCGGFYGDDIKENGVLDHLGEEDKEFLLTNY